MKFQGDIIVTDPMYIVSSEEDWHACEYGENMEELGITTYLTHDRGDCVGSVILDADLLEQGVRKTVGEVCHDSGMVSVLLLSEVLAYNPTALEDAGPNNYALIKDFDGEVTAEEFEEDPDTCECWRFRFRGNRNLLTGESDD